MLLKANNKYVDLKGLDLLEPMYWLDNLGVLAVNRRGKQHWYIVYDKSDGKYYYLRMSNDCDLKHKGKKIPVYC